MDVFVNEDPAIEPHICGVNCCYIGQSSHCPVSGRPPMSIANAPRQLTLRGEPMDIAIDTCIWELYGHPIREQMHLDALRVIRTKHYEGSSVVALQAIRRDYCALTESYFPWVWTKSPPTRLIARVTRQIKIIINSKWVTHKRINLKLFIISLLYVFMGGVNYRGIVIFPIQYRLLSMFPTKTTINTPYIQNILKQLRTNPHVRDMTKLANIT